MNLKKTPPHEAKNRYLTDRKTELSSKTLYNYKTSIGMFCDWLNEQGIHDLREIDSDWIQQYKEHRLEEVAPITARNDMSAIKKYIEFCETIHAVPKELSELIRIPKTTEEDEICDDILTRDEAMDILAYLKKYEYASTRHVAILILWKTGMRLGGLRALDVGDVDEARPALELRNRPREGTPLKQRRSGERDVIINDEMVDIITDYIENNRPDVTDEYGRKPLIASRQGRMAETTLQRHCYSVTRPCHYGNPCPEGRDEQECPATEWNKASQCPASVSPHALRRGYVTAARNAGQPKDVTGNRVDMTGRVLDRHYDKGTTAEKAERRRDYLKDI